MMKLFVHSMFILAVGASAMEDATSKVEEVQTTQPQYNFEEDKKPETTETITKPEKTEEEVKEKKTTTNTAAVANPKEGKTDGGNGYGFLSCPKRRGRGFFIGMFIAAAVASLQGCNEATYTRTFNGETRTYRGYEAVTQAWSDGQKVSNGVQHFSNEVSREYNKRKQQLLENPLAKAAATVGGTVGNAMLDGVAHVGSELKNEMGNALASAYNNAKCEWRGDGSYHCEASSSSTSSGLSARRGKGSTGFQSNGDTYLEKTCERYRQAGLQLPSFCE